MTESEHFYCSGVDVYHSERILKYYNTLLLGTESVVKCHSLPLQGLVDHRDVSILPVYI